MASTSEVGHAKNIANLNLLNTHIIALGDIYQPSNTKLRLTNMQARYQLVSGHQDTVNELTAPYSLAVDARESTFKPINPNLTGLRKSYKATEGVTAAHLEDLMTIIRRIKGKRSPGSATDPESHSVAQLSYDQRTNQMGLLISQLQNTPNFAPNEAQYTVTYYQGQKTEMLARTQAVGDTFVPLNNARATRDYDLYHGPDNAIGLAQLAKDYIGTIIPRSSPQYKAIAAIKFRKD